MKSFKQILQIISEAKATPCGRCGTTHVPPSKGGTCPALQNKEEVEVDEAYKDMTPAERDAFAQKIGDRARAAERSKKVSSMGAYRGRRVRKEEAELEEQFVIHKNGKPLKIKGKEVTTTSQQSAQKAIDTMMKQPFNKDAKFTIVKSKSAPQTTRPRDPNAYKRYTMQRKRIPDWRYAERGE